MFDLKINLYIVVYNKMAGKNSKQSKKTETEQVATPAVVAPVVATPVVAAPVAAPQQSASQKGGSKKGKAAKSVEQQVAEVVATPAIQATPATAVQATTTTQKGGKGKKAKAEAETVAQVAVVVQAVETAPKKGGAKKETAPKKGGAKKVKETKVETKVEAKEGEEETGDKHVRSFKVKLPNTENYEGRFTGLTPYQAANKALSKYFRESKKTDDEVTFSICESTRNSKKNVYTYNGRRHKLDVPVTYKIQDGREIVKNFKNTLKKVKKTELNASS